MNKSRFVIIYLLLIAAGLYINLHSDIAVPVNRPLGEIPARHGGWESVSRSVFSEKVLEVLKPTDYLCRRYLCPDGSAVTLYIGFHDGGKESGEIHSPKHCLPGGGWHEMSSGRMALATTAGEVNLVKAVYQKGESRELLLYWFQVQDKTLSDEYSLKLAEITNSMIHRRRDAAFIRISVPFEGEEDVAMAVGVRFIRDFYPLIRDSLPS